jgi:hypothetical protein
MIKMKSITMRFEFPDNLTHHEVLDIINGCISDMDIDVANVLTYTVLERK